MRGCESAGHPKFCAPPRVLYCQSFDSPPVWFRLVRLRILGGVPDQAVDDTRISTVWMVERSTWHANSLRQHTH